MAFHYTGVYHAPVTINQNTHLYLALGLSRFRNGGVVRLNLFYGTV